MLTRNNVAAKYAVDTCIEGINAIFEKHCRVKAAIAATKIIIACHLFQRETGRKPATLDELVPDYLPAVPLDPFDGNPFRYDSNKGVIWSVGTNLIDYGGVDDTPPERLRGNPWKGKNAIFKIWEE
ncbi:MAG: hypothetical protein FWG05_00775 [Kiritimatiellaeota bacterium]|nr:hypothetical protein [Kiritimatiellota bacterium]